MRIAGSQITTFQDYNRGPNESTAYDNSNIVTDLRLILRDIQTSDELHESVPNNGQLADAILCKLSEPTSGENCEKVDV